MKKTLPQVKIMVEKTLKKHEYTRDDDTDLLLKIWELYFAITPKSSAYVWDDVYIIPVKTFKQLPNKDDVKRIRARYNQLWYYISKDPEVRRKRRMSEDAYKSFLSYNV